MPSLSPRVCSALACHHLRADDAAGPRHANGQVGATATYRCPGASNCIPPLSRGCRPSIPQPLTRCCMQVYEDVESSSGSGSSSTSVEAVPRLSFFQRLFCCGKKPLARTDFAAKYRSSESNKDVGVRNKLVQMHGGCVGSPVGMGGWALKTHTWCRHAVAAFSPFSPPPVHPSTPPTGQDRARPAAADA